MFSGSMVTPNKGVDALSHTSQQRFIHPSLCNFVWGYLT